MDEHPIEIGRVLRASTTGFAVGCRVNQLSSPAFGSLVKARPVESREAIYGLIYDINIDDDQLIRRLVMIENPRQEVIEDQRRNRLLPIEMSVLAIGYRQQDQIHHGLPPRPPLNLDPVHLCQDHEEVTRFTGDLGYLRLILRAASSRIPVDQLLVAHINDVYLIRGKDVAWATAAVHELIELLRSNYEVLIPTLEALSETLPILEIDA
ncbi:MAG: hypothetical protein JSV68_16060 [Anaerolineaceae bacterium]|nr:MAG: hypothetical protein JSV68_16060 [Anaerolineaceae bacterium]